MVVQADSDGGRMMAGKALLLAYEWEDPLTGNIAAFSPAGDENLDGSGIGRLLADCYTVCNQHPITIDRAWINWPKRNTLFRRYHVRQGGERIGQVLWPMCRLDVKPRYHSDPVGSVNILGPAGRTAWSDILAQVLENIRPRLCDYERQRDGGDRRRRFSYAAEHAQWQRAVLYSSEWLRELAPYLRFDGKEWFFRQFKTPKGDSA